MKEAVVILGHLDMEPKCCEAIIGVDRGAWYAAQKGLRMELAIGDFDSVSDEERAFLASCADRVVVLPKVKDETDGEAAFAYLQGKYDLLHVYGGLGGRLDHEFANYYLLLRQSMPMILYNPNNKVYVLPKGKHTIQKDGYQYVSFFALKDTIITLKDSKYEVQDVLLRPFDVYAVSNEIIGTSMQLVCNQSVFVFQTNDGQR